jgi:hypothetical protein
MAVRQDREEYVRRYARRARADMTADLASLTTVVLQHTAGVDHVGVTLVTEDGVIRSLVASDGQAQALDNIQRGCGQGPCLDAAVRSHVVRVGDLVVETRWPDFCREAVVCTPVRAVLAFPVFHDGNMHAALNLYADRVGAFDAATEAVGALTADRVAEALTVGRGQPAQASSPAAIAIDEATNLLMRRFGIDVAQAFALLVKLAKQQGDSIETVARELVSGGT